MSTPITLEEVAAALPASLKRSVSQSMVDTLNTIASDPETTEYIRNNFVTYVSVLRDGKYKTEDYLSAVAYVSYKLMGDNNQDAWAKTFPGRHAALMQRGASPKEISAHVSAYNKGQLVNRILEQSLVPSWVLNQGIFQQAINQQAELMMTAQSEKVRSDAANSLLTHLKRPETLKAELSIEVTDNSGMNEMKRAMEIMARRQQELLQGGARLSEITDATIIEHEAQPNGAAQADPG